MVYSKAGTAFIEVKWMFNVVNCNQCHQITNMGQNKKNLLIIKSNEMFCNSIA